jgi:toxin ParE1/3/4
MGQIRWTQEAHKWLREIYDYIALDKPDAALQTVKGIVQKVKTLREHPEIGYHLIHPSKRKIRVLLYGHYRIAYEIDAKLNVNILGVFHGSLDLNRHLNKTKRK